MITAHECDLSKAATMWSIEPGCSSQTVTGPHQSNALPVTIKQTLECPQAKSPVEATLLIQVCFPCSTSPLTMPSMQCQPITNTACVTDTCGFNSSIDSRTSFCKKPKRHFFRLESLDLVFYFIALLALPCAEPL